jgi:hypothetical protein
MELLMTEDPRCCGSGTCIIDATGRCWCGQQWDGEKMCHAPLMPTEGHAAKAAAAPEPPHESLERVIDLDAEVSDCRLQPGSAQQQL